MTDAGSHLAGGERGDMALPWATALYVFRKLLPVVIAKAPELLRTLDRRRTGSVRTNSPSTASSLELLQERIEAQDQLIATQAELLAQLQAVLNSTRRSLALAWMVLLASVLLGTTIAVALFFRS